SAAEHRARARRPPQRPQASGARCAPDPSPLSPPAQPRRGAPSCPGGRRRLSLTARAPRHDALLPLEAPELPALEAGPATSARLARAAVDPRAPTGAQVAGRRPCPPVLVRLEHPRGEIDEAPDVRHFADR